MTIERHHLRLQVGGTVNPRTGVYVVRPSDDELLQLLERGEYANVLCSRQMGKSSLLMRTKSRLEKKGYAVAAIDVAGYLGSPSNADDWYQGLLDEIVRQLRLNLNVSEWWESSRAITPNQRLIRFFRDEIAVKSAKKVLVFLDEIDSTFKLQYTDDFFVAIRAMYNDRPSEPLYDRIGFCLVGVASPNELIKDRRTTPYNIGRTIELQDFDPERDNLIPLFQAMASDPLTGEAIVHSVLRWTGGHPYLTVRLCDQLVASNRTPKEELSRLLKEEFSSLEHLHSDVHFQQVLRFLGERVEDRIAALTLYRRILSGQNVKDHTTPAHIAIKLAGLVKRDRVGCLMVRNEIYARVFTTEWASRSLEPDVQPFDKLLELLAPDRELAGEEYERLRQGLVRFFVGRGSDSAEDLADKTLERVVNRLDKGEVIQDLARYCFGVARRILMEDLRAKKKEVDIEFDLLQAPFLEESLEPRYECLDRCLQQLSVKDRELILEYYTEAGREKIEQRKALAEKMGIPINVLWIRISRLRQRLQDCVRQCLDETTR
jgi:RNA polymerase sigma factor (sigma-70 family)